VCSNIGRVILLFASQRSEVNLTLLALVLGLVIGIAGHIGRSRWLILLGITIIAVVSVLFSFVLRPS
jgi:hypothetical protein